MFFSFGSKLDNVDFGYGYLLNDLLSISDILASIAAVLESAEFKSVFEPERCARCSSKRLGDRITQRSLYLGKDQAALRKNYSWVKRIKFATSINAGGIRKICQTEGSGRNYYGIEKETKYFKAAEERLKKTKPIEDDFLDTLKNNRSKPRIPFGSLVELGIINPGTNIFDQKKKVNAKIMADGSIKHSKVEGSIHKVAATILGAESCNGWTYWHYNMNGSMVPIDNLRQRLISSN